MAALNPAQGSTRRLGAVVLALGAGTLSTGGTGGEGRGRRRLLSTLNRVNLPPVDRAALPSVPFSWGSCDAACRASSGFCASGPQPIASVADTKNPARERPGSVALLANVGHMKRRGSSASKSTRGVDGCLDIHGAGFWHIWLLLVSRRLRAAQVHWKSTPCPALFR